MAYVKNKMLYVLNPTTKQHEAFYTVNNEIFLTADKSDVFSYTDYINSIYSGISIKTYRVHLLNDDETVLKDISEYVCACNLSFNHNQGTRASGSISFLNTNGKFAPNVFGSYVWEGRKIQIEVGIYANGRIFWDKKGIFVFHNPTVNSFKKIVSVSIFDKFSRLDGTVCGKKDSSFKINVGTSIKTALKNCLISPVYSEMDADGNFVDVVGGEVYDTKKIYFPSSITNSVTPYTITKDPNCTMGEIVITLAEMVFCDVYYNKTGNLLLKPDNDSTNFDTAPIQWIFDENKPTYSEPMISYDFSNVAKRVIVTGAIQVGKQFKGIYINENPWSKHFTKNTLYVNDSNIISNDLCKDRAKYEFQKNCRLNLQVKMKSVFIPHLWVDDIVIYSDSNYGYKNERFIINEISMDLFSNDFNISMSLLKGVRA